MHIPENRNASSATSEQRSVPNRMNNYNAIMMAGLNIPVRRRRLSGNPGSKSPAEWEA